MSRVKKIQIGLAPDQTVVATSVQIVSVIRLIGSGLLEQSPHDYVGPCGGHFITTDEGAATHEGYIEYDVDIPIGIGGDINIQMNSVNEVLAAGTITVGLVFDDTPVTAKNNMADFVEAVVGAAGSFVAVATLIVPSGEAGKAPSKIKKVIVGLGIDQGVAAFALRHALSVRLTGSGLKGGGIHEYVGPHGDTGVVVTGGAILLGNTVEIDTDLPVNPAGEIDVEQILITEVPTAGTTIVGVLYE